MKKVRDSSESEMILTFLKGEIASQRFNEKLNNVLNELGYKKELILDGDFSNQNENVQRKNIMIKFRGYPTKELFENFPNIAHWDLVEFDKNDLDNIYYINYDYWNELSNNTSKPKEVAKTIKSGKEIYEVSNEPFIKGAELVSKTMFPPVILITCNDKKYLIIEGHSRMTIYGLRPDKFNGTYGYIGHCTEQEMKQYDPRMVVLDRNYNNKIK